MAALTSREVRMVYLITYSQADIERFDKESFATLVSDAFTNVDNTVRVTQWVCCRERHQDGGYHFHLAIKLNKLKRWLSVKRTLSSRHNVEVNFSSVHNDYYSAWHYVTKESDYVESVGHPDLRSASVPRTSNALAVRRRRRGEEGSEGSSNSVPKKCRLDNLVLNEAILNNNIKTITDGELSVDKLSVAQLTAAHCHRITAFRISYHVLHDECTPLI